MFYIIYVSDATKAFDNAELLALLAKSRQKNTQNGITGMLLYKSGSFMQVLEGEESEVRKLYANIEQDNRHNNIMVLDEGYASQRQFQEWSMGFKNLDELSSETIDGYNQFMNKPLSAQSFKNEPSLCWDLLVMFKVHH